MSERADVFSRIVAAALQDELDRKDIRAVRHIASDLVETGGIPFVRVFDKQGRSVAAYNGPNAAAAGVLVRTAPLIEGGRKVGSVTIGYPAGWIDSLLDIAALQIGVVALVLVVLSALATYIFGNHLLRFLVKFRAAAAQVANGEFAIKIQESGPTELRALAEAFNSMSDRIAALYAQTRQLLEQRTHALSSTFAHMSDGVAIFDRNGMLIAANNAFGEQLGFESIPVGMMLNVMVDAFEAAAPEGSKPADLTAKCRQIEWPEASLEFEIPLPNGRNLSVRRTRLPDGGFIAIHRDTTDARESERKLRHAAKLSTLGELATATAHEINQPLNVIRLAADNARARIADKRATTEYLEGKLARISEQTERAAAIIDHMRQFGRKPLDKVEVFDLAAAVRSTGEFFSETARLRGVRLVFDLEEHLLLYGRRSLTEQVVANLLSNAMSALKEKGINDGAISVRGWKRDSWVVLEVRDNAGGIPPEVLPHIFEPFFTTKASGEGTGLGLSISYGIISDMGGTISAENCDTGAVFTIELPLAPAPDQCIPAQ
jgi:signal transduction histidine kinase